MPMEQRIFHGQFSPDEFADCLLVQFNRGNLIVQKIANGDNVSVQIKTRDGRTSGGETALGILFQPVEDGILVQAGQQTWAGIAASLGASAVAALINPLNLLHRIDDIAQDFEYIQLNDEVWNALESNAKALGSGYDLSKNLRRVVCDYCQTTNATGDPSCIACGAPLGYSQPRTCSHCGFILENHEKYCPNCKKSV
jgi:hypothetical protein